MPFGETLAALATPVGESAIAMIRLSGPDCARLACECTGLARAPAARKATLVEYKSLDNNILDKCLMVLFSGTGTYTGEPMLELSLHGNPLIAQLVLEDLFARGCRAAEPGEFTKTAFLNSKLDLSQAEAVADLINARSTRALHVAHRQLSGAIGERMQSYTNRLLSIQAELEAYIDFPEEDLPEEEHSGPTKEIISLTLEISKLIGTQHYATLLHDGVKAVIVGAPNAGKSSLLNTLAGQDRVIVSDQPGTTRDVVAERIVVGDYVMQLMDTAGLHDSSDSIEQMGMQKTLEWLDNGDLFLVVVDSTAPSPALPPEALAKLRANNTLVVENKIDLGQNKTMDDFLPDCTHVRLSLKTGDGYEAFRDELTKVLSAGHIVPDQDELIVSARHATALSRAIKALDATIACLKDSTATEIAASELRVAVEAFGEVVGKIDNEAMLDQLFASFCIGK